MSSLVTLRRLVREGKLVLWHDYRSGMLANFGVALPAGTDTKVQGTSAVFRTGRGFSTVHNGADSLGYVQIDDIDAWTPAVGGCAIIASYEMVSTALDAQIIGQSDGGASISWALVRKPGSVLFQTSDGAGFGSVSLVNAATRAVTETVTVRYTGGTTGTNCEIAILAPTAATNSGTISRVPQDLASPLTIGANSGAGEPLHGTLRYVAFINGAVSAADLTACAEEIEAVVRPTALSVVEKAAATVRNVQVQTAFGPDTEIVDPSPVLHGFVSNSPWRYADDSGNYGHVRAVARDVTGVHHWAKALVGDSSSLMYLDVRDFRDSVEDIHDYGTWDIWEWRNGAGGVFFGDSDFWLTSDTVDGTNDGYFLRLSTTVSLYSSVGGVQTALITGATLLIAEAWVRVRVTRETGTDVWKLYVNLGLGWIYEGTVTDASAVSGPYWVFDPSEGDAVSLDSADGRMRCYKWRGVVNPL